MSCPTCGKPGAASIVRAFLKAAAEQGESGYFLAEEWATESWDPVFNPNSEENEANDFIEKWGREYDEHA